MPPRVSAPTSIWQPPLRRLTLGLAVVVVATAFEALAVATILPTTVRELGGLALYGWTFSAFMLANLIGISVGGSESDRLGAARLFLAGVILFALGLLISGLAPTMSTIVVGRVWQGFGAGLLSTVAYASIAKAYAVDLQPRMLATLSSAWVIPGLISPGVAGLIAEHASWRWVFLGLIPLPLMAAGLVLPALRALPVSAAVAPRNGRIAQALQLGLGVGAALTGLGLQSWLLMLVLVLGGGALALRALARLLPAGTLVVRAGLPAAIVCMALLNFAFFGTEAFVPLALTRVRGAPVLLIGLSLTAAALTWTAGAWLPVRLPGVSRRRLIASGLGLLALGLLATLSLLAANVPAVFAVPAWGLSGLGMGLAFTTTSAAILEASPPGEEGMASAALQLAQVLGIALATGIGGAIVAAPFAGEPPTRGIATVDLLMLSAIALASLTARRVPEALAAGAPDQPAH
jgi:MFS family permease